MRLIWACFFSVWALPLAAMCTTPDATFFACTFSQGTKAVSLCVEGEAVRYQFGPVGAEAELTLQRSVVGLDYTPWPGIGRNIYEQVKLQNDGYTYEVYGVIERIWPDDPKENVTVFVDGGVDVIQNETRIASLRCDKGSVDFRYTSALYDAMTAANQCWSNTEFQWGQCR